jgi:hypothetical protein
VAIVLGAGRAIFEIEPCGAIFMPMDAKEFKRRVAEHFKNVTKEEFLRNLQKSSPYLFTEESGKPKEFNMPTKPEIDNSVLAKHE